MCIRDRFNLTALNQSSKAGLQGKLRADHQGPVVAVMHSTRLSAGREHRLAETRMNAGAAGTGSCHALLITLVVVQGDAQDEPWERDVAVGVGTTVRRQVCLRRRRRVRLDMAAQSPSVRPDCKAAGGHAAAGNRERVSSLLEARKPTRLWAAAERGKRASYEMDPVPTSAELFVTERCA